MPLFAAVAYDLPDTPSTEEVRDLLTADPFFDAGIWHDPEVRPFTAAVGTLVAGITG